MPASSTITANLACVLALLRDRASWRDAHVAAFRALIASFGDAPVSLAIESGGLIVNRTPVWSGTPGLAEARGVLESHGVGEVLIPAGVQPPPLLALLRALAAAPDVDAPFRALTSRLDDTTRGVIRLAPRGAGPLAPAPATEAPLVREPDPVEPLPPIARVEGVVSMSGIGAPPISAQLGGMVVDRQADDEITGYETAAARARAPMEASLARLRDETDTTRRATRVNELVASGDEAARRGDWDEVIRVAGLLAELDEQAPSHAGRVYAIALRRLLPRYALEQVARRAGVGPNRTEAIAALKRLGAEATEVLLQFLASAPTMAERRGYYAALRQITASGPLVLNMLTHDEWYVVRNIADLCGDLRLADAVVPLARHLAHPDERVRRAVAGALAKIGGAATTEPLRRALKDAAPTVRLEAVQHLGPESRALTRPLADLFDQEALPDLQRQVLAALGRIGNPEAVRTLARAAEPGGRLFNRRPSAVRLAAIEGLRAAGGAAALQALEPLVADDDPQVRQGAQTALAALQRDAAAPDPSAPGTR